MAKLFHWGRLWWLNFSMNAEQEIANAPENHEKQYQLKEINFKGRLVDIVLEVGNPTLFIALYNVLIIKGDITLKSTDLTDNQHLITHAKLKEVLAKRILFLKNQPMNETQALQFEREYWTIQPYFPTLSEGEALEPVTPTKYRGLG